MVLVNIFRSAFVPICRQRFQEFRGDSATDEGTVKVQQCEDNHEVIMGRIRRRHAVAIAIMLKLVALLHVTEPLPSEVNLGLLWHGEETSRGTCDVCC